MSEQSNFSVDHFFDPSSKDFIHDPVPTLERLSAEYPIARFEAWQAWLVTGHQNIISCLLDRPKTRENISSLGFPVIPTLPPPNFPPVTPLIPLAKALSNKLNSLYTYVYL